MERNVDGAFTGKNEELLGGVEVAELWHGCQGEISWNA